MNKGKLTWIKRRTREYEFFEFLKEDEDDRPLSRRELLKAAIEDYNWMIGNETAI